MNGEPEFDRSVRLAADCLVDAYGRDGALEELRERRQSGADGGRVNEALAYLKYRGGE